MATVPNQAIVLRIGQRPVSVLYGQEPPPHVEADDSDGQNCKHRRTDNVPWHARRGEIDEKDASECRSERRVRLKAQWTDARIMPHSNSSRPIPANPTATAIGWSSYQTSHAARTEAVQV